MEQFARLREEYPAWRRSSEEELVNAITHGFGFCLAVAGSLVLMTAVMPLGNTTIIAGCAVYLLTLMSVYAMSTMSHMPTSFRARLIFRRLDQAFIYLLIAGTFTAFSLAFLHGWKWNALLASMWFVAITGFIAKVFFGEQVFVRAHFRIDRVLR